MGRWAPGGRGRLEEAAYDLFEEQGYDTTTVAQIAARAGLTERTFYRHFADKREVIFGGTALVEALLVESVAAAAPEAAPLDVLAAVFGRLATEVFVHRVEAAIRRRSIIASSDELQERELIKLAGWCRSLAAALEARGIPPLSAALAAEAGVAAFRVAFEQWTDEGAGRPLTAHLDIALAELRALAAGPTAG